MRCGNITALTIFWIFAHENNDLHCAEMSFLGHLPSMNFWYAIGARNDWCLPIWSVDYIEEAFWKPSYHKFPVFHSSEFSKYHPVACNYLRVVLAGSWSLAKWSGVDSLSIGSFLFCSFTLFYRRDLWHDWEMDGYQSSGKDCQDRFKVLSQPITWFNRNTWLDQRNIPDLDRYELDISHPKYQQSDDEVLS